MFVNIYNFLSIFTLYILTRLSNGDDWPWPSINLELNEPISFVAMGDWGGPDKTFTTDAQLSTAEMMNKYASTKNLSFILLLGDNFYPHGLYNDHDASFDETFRKVYLRKRNLKKKKWYVVAGDHDHHKGNAAHETKYTKQCDAWIFPDLFYTITIKMKLRNTKKKFWSR